MKKSNQISVKYPLSINFNTFSQYNLSSIALDEIVFFEWLIVKKLSFGSDEFFYQNERITKELSIKRHRLEKIKNKFMSFGLDIELKGTNNISNYFISETFIKNFVETHLLEPYKNDTLKQLLNLDFKNEINVSKAEKKRIEEFIKDLEETYNRRRKKYINHTEGRKCLVNTGLSYNRKTFQQFSSLLKRYSKDTISNSFTCYVDDLITHDDNSYHILNNFSTYDRAKDSFPVFENKLNKFNNCYEVTM